MWIQVRSMDGKKCVRIDGLSKLTKIEQLREKLIEKFDAPPENQRLFYRGKQLEDGHSLFDYNVGLNEIIQILIRQYVPPSPVKTPKKSEESTDKENQGPSTSDSEEIQTTDGEGKSTYRIGDVVDVQDETMGAWFEAKITKITRNKNAEDKQPLQEKLAEIKPLSDCNANIADQEKTSDNFNSTVALTKDDGFSYHVIYEGYEDDAAVPVPVKCVRPRARVKLGIDKIQVGDRVMVNYNYDEPDARGYWYDAVITGKRNTRSIKELVATVFIGKDLLGMTDSKILLWNEVFAIEKAGSQLNMNDPDTVAQSPAKRTNKPDCDFCKDNPKKKCKECACCKCGDKKDPDKQIMCDECDSAWHLYCLSPPLDSVPDVDEWYCPLCKNDDSQIVKVGEKLKESKKKSKMASATGKSNRDWGKGMACVGRQKICNTVPTNHFGVIPGVEVGTLWKFRVQVSEAGVHRPHVAGIAGREAEGAYSIVLSGGYEDDKDDGDVFTYTGSGGRDLSGNKRTAEQSMDQTLTRMNAALAKNVFAPMNKKDGADAGDDWKKGKPVRVVRNCKGAKHSKYAPEEGNRYDGIYKIKKYWPQKGKSGFLVWRYEMRRDDPIPAPWTKAGKKRIAELGNGEMQYPEGYLEQQQAKEKEKEDKKAEKDSSKIEKKKGKRKRIDSDSEGESDAETQVVKKSKPAEYKIAEDVQKLMKEDKENEKLWEEAMIHTCEGGQKFLAQVEELFCCVCCQDLVFKPITTSCSHNICKSCLQRSFKAEVYSCPACRNELGKDYSMKTNESLIKILNKLFPGYEAGR